jgi:signal transduction histidine kinase
MRPFILLICALVAVAGTKAQSEKDSLRKVMTAKGKYAQKIEAYLLFEEKFGLQDFNEMLRVGKEGITLAIKNDDPISIAQLKKYVGEAWYFQGKYDSAANYFYEAISILEPTKEKRKLAAVYNSLAKLYRKTRDLDRATATYNKALEIFQSLEDERGISMIMNESGVVFEYAGEYDKATDRYNTSLYIAKELKDSVGVSYALSNLAGVYTLQRKYKEAEQFLKEVLLIRKLLKDTFSLALVYSDLGATFAAASDFTTARKYIDSSNIIVQKMQYPELQQANFNLLAEMAQKQGDYKTALNYFQKRSLLRDSLFGLEKTKQIEELSTRYETVKKEQKIQEQQHRISLQNLIIWGAVLLFVLLLLLTFSQYKRIKWKQEAKLQSEMIRQQEMATKAVLEAEEGERQRIAKDLHDSLGQMMSAAKMNLSAFEHKVQFNNADEKLAFQNIISLVDDSCKEVRTVSHNMMPNALLKNNLAAALQEFIDKLHYSNIKVHLYTEGLDKPLHSNLETVLYRVIQECVNNVIKHSGADTLDISVIKDATEITATVEDNGKGFDVRLQENLEGIGLKNIRTRVAYLKGTVDFESEIGKGTLVAIHIPL